MPLIYKNFSGFKVENDHVILKPEYIQSSKWSFKKITGTRLAAILGKNKYNSPFKAWMGMVNLYKDVMDPTLAQAGNVIEPKIRDYVTQQLGIKFKVHNPVEIRWDAFSENKIFGGIPDGEPMNDLKVIDYSNNKPMLEIKTSSIDSFVYKRERNELKMQKDASGLPLIKEKGSKKASWFNSEQRVSIPTEYCLQLALYLYLRNITHGIFAIGFLEPEDYLHPELFQTSNREIKIVDFNIKREQVTPLIEYAEKWYNEHIIKGVSPLMTKDDQEWLRTEMELLGN